MVRAPAPVVGFFVCAYAGSAVGGVFDVCAAPVADTGTVAGAGAAELRVVSCVFGKGRRLRIEDWGGQEEEKRSGREGNVRMCPRVDGNMCSMRRGRRRG